MICSSQKFKYNFFYQSSEKHRSELNNLQKPKMCAQGPNFISLSRLKNAQQAPEESYRSEQDSNSNRINHIEKMLQNNREYERIINDLKKEFEHAAHQVHITEFYPEFITDNDYEEDIEKRIIQDDQLAALIHKLQHENRILKSELRAWTQEFGKKAHLSHVLIKQNGLIRQQMVQKNKDLLTLIQALGKGYGPDIEQLELSLQDLTQQNNVLLQHLDKTQQTITSLQEQRKALEEFMEEALKQREEVKSRLDQLIEEEEHHGKQHALVEYNLETTRREVERLRAEEQRLTQIKADLERDNQQLSELLTGHKNEVGEIKKTLKKENADKEEEFHQLSLQNKNLAEQLSKLTLKEKQVETEVSRNDRNSGEYDNILKSTTEKLKELTPNLKKAEDALQTQLEKEAQRGSEARQLQCEISMYEAKLANLKAKKQVDAEDFPKTLKQLIQSKESERKAVEKEISILQSQHSTELISLNSEVKKQRSELDRLQRELESKVQDIQELRNRIQECKQNKRNLPNLMNTLRSKNMELTSLRNSVRR